MDERVDDGKNNLYSVVVTFSFETRKLCAQKYFLVVVVYLLSSLGYLDYVLSAILSALSGNKLNNASYACSSKRA